MKISYILFLFSTGVLLSCSSPNTQNAQTESAKDSTVQGHHDAKSEGALTLNNGKKWKADSITNFNVKALQKTANDFRAGNKNTIDEYHSAGKNLENGINKLLADCKMQGAEHEALHKWILPVLEDIKKINAANETGSAETAFAGILEKLNNYNNYFE